MTSEQHAAALAYALHLCLRDFVYADGSPTADIALSALDAYKQDVASGTTERDPITRRQVSQWLFENGYDLVPRQPSPQRTFI